MWTDRGFLQREENYMKKIKWKCRNKIHNNRNNKDFWWAHSKERIWNRWGNNS